ncbi:MAG: hypothetical protein KDJ65_34160 [Anaerolineae bacterium]|nr:hypothetical protein [Anaerolineae bacterium]
MNDADQYFAVCFQIKHAEYFLIWVSSDTDRLVLSPKNLLMAFANIGELNAFAAKNDLIIHSEKPPIYDFDTLADWIRAPNINNIDCETFLNAWNMLGDIEKSFERKLKEPNGSNTVYDKLFYGNNLLSITPEGEHYIPEWSDDEVTIMVSVFRSGLETLYRVLDMENNKVLAVGRSAEAQRRA